MFVQLQRRLLIFVESEEGMFLAWYLIEDWAEIGMALILEF